MKRSKLLLAIALVIVAAIAPAATLQVPSQYRTLQKAINAAKTGDTIVIAAGTYYEAQDIGTIQWGGKDLVIQGAGAGKTTFDARGLERILAMSGTTAASRIEGITFNNGSQAAGGAILNMGGVLTVANCAFTMCSGANGGAIMNDGGSATITNCTFTANRAMSNGSCVYNQNSNVTITHCVFEKGVAGVGGVLHNDHCNARIANCVFRNNQGYNGCGICNFASNPTVVDCAFYNNMAFNDGGALYNSFSSNATVVNCTFANNQARSNFNSGLGGAICNVTTGGYGSNGVTLVNSIVWANNSMAAADTNAIHGPFKATFTDLQDLKNATPDASGNFMADPLFTDLKNGNLVLTAKSPCVDHGDNSAIAPPNFVAVAPGVFTDQLGCNRIAGAKVDLGPYEFLPVTDITAKIGIKKVGAPPKGKDTVFQSLAFTNNTGVMLTGPVSIVLSDLKGYKLVNGSGVTKALTPAGRPYFNLAMPLIPPGVSMPVLLKFTKSGSGELSFNTHVFDGVGSR